MAEADPILAQRILLETMNKGHRSVLEGIKCAASGLSGAFNDIQGLGTRVTAMSMLGGSEADPPITNDEVAAVFGPGITVAHLGAFFASIAEISKFISPVDGVEATPGFHNTNIYRLAK